MNVEDEIIELHDRLDVLEALAFAEIRRVAREEAKKVVDEELAELREELW